MVGVTLHFTKLCIGKVSKDRMRPNYCLVAVPANIELLGVCPVENNTVTP